MKNAAITPGEWRIETDGRGHHIVTEVGPEKMKVHIATAHGMRPDDARLMMAAPALLKELVELQWSHDESDGEGGTIWACPSCGQSQSDGHSKHCSLNAAIAKATRKS